MTQHAETGTLPKTTSPRSKIVESAFHQACSECPWRLSNQNKPHPGGWYTKANLKRLWAALRRGERMSCHPTDSRMNQFPWRPVSDGAVPHECAGMLILQQREMMNFQRICEADPKRTDALKVYRQQNPGGMTRLGLVSLVERAVFGGTVFGGMKMTRPNLNDPDIGYEPLKWDFPKRSNARNHKTARH